MGKTYEAMQRAERDGQERRLHTRSTGEATTDNIIPHAPEKIADVYLELKTKLTTQYPEETLRTIMVTGVVEQVGTSKMAAGLASAFAFDQPGKVLLVDADLRTRRGDGSFRTEAGYGLSHLLSGECSRLSPLFKVGTENLFLLPHGERKMNALTFFQNRQFDELITALQTRFDHVVFDVPSVIGYDEPKVIGKKMSGVILVAAAGKTRRRVAMRAKAELVASGSNLLGIILNRRRQYIPDWVYRRL